MIPSVVHRIRGEWIVGAAAVLASCTGLLNDFVYDDIPLIRDNARVHELSRLWEAASRPYWPPPFVEQLFRPVSVLSLNFQYVVGGGEPMVFRLVSFALYALSAALLFRFLMRFVDRGPAMGVGLLFAVHPVHVEAVALGVNQGELIVGIAALLMVERYVTRRNGAGLETKDWVYLAFWYAIAAATKENGLVLPALLLAADVTLVTPSHTSSRVQTLWRGFAVLAGVVALNVFLRRLVLGDAPLGAVAVQDLRGLNFHDRMTLMVAVVPEWARLFFWPARLQADYSLEQIGGSSLFGWREVWAFVLIVTVPVAAISARKRHPVVSFGMLWCLIGLLPVSNIVPTGVLLAERTLFLPSIGVAIAVAGWSQWALNFWRGRAARIVLVSTAGLLVALGLARSIGRHSVWNPEHLRIVNKEKTSEMRDLRVP